jgi:hypothetical protein
MTSLFPPRESLVSDIPAEEGNIEKLFVRCTVLVLAPTLFLRATVAAGPGEQVKKVTAKAQRELTQ